MDQQGIGSLNAGSMGSIRPAMGNVSDKGGLREIDIINAYFRSANISPRQAMQLIQAAVKSGVKFKRIGNTVMGYKPLSQTAMQVYFFSVDHLREITDAISKALSMIKQAGIQEVYLSKEDPMIMQALQSLGVNAHQSDRPEYKVKAIL